MFLVLLSVYFGIIMICILFVCWLYCHLQQNDVIQNGKKLKRRLYTVKDRISGTQLLVAMNDDFAIIL